MFSKPSPSRETFTRYRESDAVESDREKTSIASKSDGPAINSNQQLLQEVLGETLVRNQENSDQLVDALRSFRQRHQSHVCDETLFSLIVREVLRHRLGQRSGKLPADLFDEVGRALWSHDESRQRIERFWGALGAAP